MKNKFNEEVINHLADNLLIGLDPVENKLILEEFNYIEDSINLINEIPGIDEAEPMTHPFPVAVSLSEDIPQKSLAIEDILKNAQEIEGREIKIPKVVGE